MSWAALSRTVCHPRVAQTRSLALLISGSAKPQSTIFDRVAIFLVGAGVGGGGGYYMLSMDMEKNADKLNAAVNNLANDQKSSIAQLQKRVAKLEAKVGK